MKSTLIFLSAAIAIGATATAQRLNCWSGIAGAISEVQPANALLPTPTPGLAIYPNFPILPPPAPALIPPGDSSFDGIAGLNIYTDGFTIAASTTPNYAPALPPFPPIAISAAALATLGGPATGLAIDSASGVIYLASAPGVVIGVLPVPGTPMVTPAIVVPFPAAPISGLEFDGLTGLLMAVDMTGTIFTFTPGGAPVMPPLVPVMLPPGLPTDLAIDKTGLLNGLGMRSVYLSVGPSYYDATLPAPIITPLAIGPLDGIAFQQMPAMSGPLAGCACGGMLPTVGATGPMVSGNPTFGLTMGGVVPGSLVIFGLDFIFTPAFPLLNASGCGVGLIPGSVTLVSAAAFADPAGTATFALPLPVPPGFGPIFAQSFTLCPADPAGFVAAPMQQIVVSDI